MQADSLKKIKMPKLGWIPDIPDARDYSYVAPLRIAKSLPAKIDLRKNCPPVFSQGNLGSCTANALNAAVEYGRKVQKKRNRRMSRLFLYYNERVMMGSESYDSGAYLRDGIKSLSKQGVCYESEWRYSASTKPFAKFTKKPPVMCYTSALNHVIGSYFRISNGLMGIKQCLAEGFPIAFGFSVYESFYSQEVTTTGIMPMPDIKTESMLGGHAVLAVGYDDEKQMVLVRNSWGKNWGDKGYFWMPYQYISDRNYCSDFWTIRKVSDY